MKKIYDNCCGIDVHKKLMVCCFIHGKEQEVREFCATTRELPALAEWLILGRCQMVAVAHSMLIAIYHILKYGVKYHDLGAGYYDQFNKERKINSYLKKLKTLGWEPPVAMAEQTA